MENPMITIVEANVKPNIEEECGYYNNLTFVAIKDFVDDLVAVFGTQRRTTPLDIYYRLISSVKPDENEDVIKKYIIGFSVFFTNNLKYIENVKTIEEIPRGTVIRYAESPKIYIDIQSFFFKTKDVDGKELIRQHLAVIAATMDPSERTLSILDSPLSIIEEMNLKHGSPEAYFISEILKKVNLYLQKEKTTDPSVAIQNLLKSGLISEMATKLKNSLSDKDMDIKNLIFCLKKALSSFVDKATTKKEGVEGDSDEEETDTLKDMLVGYQKTLGLLNDEDFEQ